MIEAVQIFDFEVAHPAITEIEKYFSKLFLDEGLFFKASVFEVWGHEENLVLIGELFDCGTDLTAYAYRGAVIETESGGSFVAEES